MAKKPKSGMKTKTAKPRRPIKPARNEATIEEFEQEGMGVASKE